MVSKRCLSFPLPLGLFALTSCFAIAPSLAQTIDDVPQDLTNPSLKVKSQKSKVKRKEERLSSGEKNFQSFWVPSSHRVPNLKIDAETWRDEDAKSDFHSFIVSDRTRESTLKIAQVPNSTTIADIPTFSLPQDTPIPSDVSPQRFPEPQLEPPTPTPQPTPDQLLQSPPLVPTAPEPVPGKIPETINVKRFEFEGNTVISDEELAEATKDYINRDLPFAQVFEVRSVITELYRKRKYVTSGAIIPPQEFQKAEGVVKVQIIEGKLESESIEVRGTRRLNPDYIRSRIALAAGTPVNQDALIEALQLLQLDPLIKSLSAELTAGTRQGSSVLIVTVEEAKSLSLDLSLNNNRSPTIGTFERRLDATLTNLRGQGDILNVGFSNTAGSNTLDATYTYPLNPRNGTLSFSTSFTFSHVVESPFNRVDIDADSRYFALTFRQPLQRSLSEEFTVGVSLTNQKSKVTIFDVPVRLAPGTEEDGTTTVTALRFFQEWTRQSNRHVFAARSQFTLGLGLLGGTSNEDAPDSNFLAWRGQVQWVSLLAPETLLILRGDLQFSLDPLLRLEQYGLGGQDTVRGYRQNIFLSDSGMLASAELRFPIARLPRQNALLQLAPFIDFGAIWNNSGNTDPEPDPNFLASVGLGLRFQMGDRLSARVDWGIPLINAISSEKTLQENGLYFSINYSIF
jgi:hemolysin activation/secretion protein